MDIPSKAASLETGSLKVNLSTSLTTLRSTGPELGKSVHLVYPGWLLCHVWQMHLKGTTAHKGYSGSVLN